LSFDQVIAELRSRHANKPRARAASTGDFSQ